MKTQCEIPAQEFWNVQWRFAHLENLSESLVDYICIKICETFQSSKFRCSEIAEANTNILNISMIMSADRLNGIYYRKHILT